jgi:hypothetical protein
MKRTLALATCLIAGLVAGCAHRGKTNKPLTVTNQTPQQTGSTVRSGTPTGPTNTAHTTTSAYP